MAAMSDETKMADAPLPIRRDRRTFLKELAAIAAGLLAMGMPALAGLLVLFDPTRRKGSKATFIQVAPLEAVPLDGTPQKFQVIAEQIDAWNKEPRVPIGAVYLKRQGSRVTAFNVVCPHAGCSVDAQPDGSFRCPCHNSSFAPGGELMAGSVSPRGLDTLEVDEAALQQGLVKVKFQNFAAATPEKIPIA
jgi:Rieske Fe-S protein